MNPAAVATVNAPLAWEELERLAPPPEDRVEGPTSAQASLRLFGQPEPSVRVTLYRDHHAWCPYCQKVWLWLEEKRVPHRILKVSMHCYGEKEAWYRERVPSGLLPALELDGTLITESDRILEVLETAFGPLGRSLQDPEVVGLRQLERRLFRAWCGWLCRPGNDARHREHAAETFDGLAGRMAGVLQSGPGPFLLGDLSSADVVFVPFLERMNASLAYYKGYLLRQRHPAVDRWFAALEERSTYLGTQGDFHTHAHDLPPQMGGCQTSGTPAQQRLAGRIDRGPWPITEPGAEDPETRGAEPTGSSRMAMARVLQHRATLLDRPPLRGEAFDGALRCALTLLAEGKPCAPPAGTASALRWLRDRICVPRDMPLHAARRLRQALEATAALDPSAPEAEPPPLPSEHRRDQDPRPFLEARRPG